MSYILFAWIASIGYGVDVVLSKITTKYQIPNIWLFNFLRCSIGLVFLVPVCLLMGAGMPENWNSIIWAGLTYGIISVLYIYCLKHLDISLLTPLFSLRVAFSFVLGLVVLGETLTWISFLLILIIIICSVTVAYDEHTKLKAFLNKNIIMAVLFMLTLAVFGVLFNLASKENGYWTSNLFINIIATMVLIPTIAKAQNGFKNLTLKQYGIVLIIACLGSILIVAEFKAYEGIIGIAAAIISLPFSMVFTFLLAKLKILKLEQHSKRVYLTRIISAAIMITAAILLSL